MATDFASLCDEIDALAQTPASVPIELDALERTLTDGYAKALLLEAEQWRLERRMSELAAEVNGVNKEDTAEELAGLAVRLTHASDDLTRLRGLLASLRARRAKALA